ncbi:Rho-binding antiterminator [Methylomonas sp. EFPC1]|uniref:Rho-binding antiterminator n=1 Tax=Methylomonas defluvii TaxID=3045149 RepID=A0ABU4UJD9_9GAMM|nr:MULTISPECIES: Rho-binding antiterminator [unclassified Methylomonas]MDX8128834.1 Rho-binding antiterminator [Methylomonas sp. OY6]QBC28467.1 transcriptional regulator [Methylomonas sp. LW13]QSB00141.1 Rho-binding antiterminator [Methylomonas sp. EFPC1]
MSESRIACDLHDYIEIACLYGYRVRLTLKDQRIVEGRALNVVTEERHEFLLLEDSPAGKIALDQLAKLQVLTSNARFTEVIF